MNASTKKKLQKLLVKAAYEQVNIEELRKLLLSKRKQRENEQIKKLKLAKTRVPITDAEEYQKKLNKPKIRACFGGSKSTFLP